MCVLKSLCVFPGASVGGGWRALQHRGHRLPFGHPSGAGAQPRRYKCPAALGSPLLCPGYWALSLAHLLTQSWVGNVHAVLPAVWHGGLSAGWGHGASARGAMVYVAGCCSRVSTFNINSCLWMCGATPQPWSLISEQTHAALCLI